MSVLLLNRKPRAPRAMPVPPMGEGKPILFAVAVERLMRVRGNAGVTWKAEMIYLHATDSANARIRFTATHDRSYRIVALGPVIGYFVNDNHGDDLSV
jgi:hypothetical protein